ncbi:MAG: molybdopterin-guanine dinucleotide biosynthesis protein B [Acidobacteriota bacterium]
MKIVAAVGLSETGKTLLLTGLIGEFKRRGLRTIAVKHCAHGFMLDTEGKDTWKYAQAGADGVAMVSSEEWAVIERAADVDMRSLALRMFAGADVVLIEGGKDAPGIRKIEVLRSGVSDVVRTPPEELLAVVSDAGAPAGTSVPVFTLSQRVEICDLILSQAEEAMADIKLEVDGREVPLNPFVRTFIENTVLGMVTSLNGVALEPKKISLTIERDAPAAEKS